MSRVIRGYQQNQQGGPALVMIDDAVLPMPALTPGEEARHSPEGFQWGYAGSGPAELARAILVALFPGDPTVRRPRVYQAFKFAVVATLPRAGFTLDGAAVEAWLEAFKRAQAICACDERGRTEPCGWCGQPMACSACRRCDNPHCGGEP